MYFYLLQFLKCVLGIDVGRMLFTNRLIISFERSNNNSRVHESFPHFAKNCLLKNQNLEILNVPLKNIGDVDINFLRKLKNACISTKQKPTTLKTLTLLK
jgi:hypothetical protein